MALTLSALRTEFLTDPIGFGFSTMIAAGNDVGLAETMNSVTRNASLAAVSTIEISQVTALVLQQQVVGTEYLALSQGARDLWNAILTTATEGLVISNTLIRGQVTAIWSAGTTTRSNLSALQRRRAARAEILGGEGTVTLVNDANKARTGQF